jgi:uncharacterized protein (TIGR02246 family)
MSTLPVRAIGATLTAVLLACAPADKAATDSAAAPATAAADPAAVRAYITEANTKWAAAMVAADVPTILANYADDAVSMQAGMPAANGRAAIEEMMKGMTAAMKIDSASFSVSDVRLGGDMAVEHGSYRITMTPTGGKAMTDVGKYVTVWQKQADGTWKITRDISNSDAAPPTK